MFLEITAGFEKYAKRRSIVGETLLRYAFH